jgi:N-formylglutamate amidohydrolase
VLGDRFGAACSGALMATALPTWPRAGSCGAQPALCRGYGLERQARREADIHAIQVEIDRSAYLDAALAEPGEGLPDVVETITGLVRALASDVAALGQAKRRWPRAADRRAARPEKTTWRQAPGGQGSGRRCTKCTNQAGP